MDQSLFTDRPGYCIHKANGSELEILPDKTVLRTELYPGTQMPLAKAWFNGDTGIIEKLERFGRNGMYFLIMECNANGKPDVVTKFNENGEAENGIDATESHRKLTND